MQLTVRTADLIAAAAALHGVAAELETAAQAFAGIVTASVPALGTGAVPAAERLTGGARQAVTAVAGDYRTAGRGLSAIAAAYAETDARLIDGGRG